ncbi:MobH family relaxase [Thiosulfatimonas sediminis]|nr:MobH family relaxase [Thiosulfatimonas sediminis]
MYQALKSFAGRLFAKPVEEVFSVPKKVHWMRVLTAKELLTPHQSELNEIREIAGLTPEHFEHYYRKPIERYAEAVQLSPASEVHHHAYEGGMLEHNLEVIVNALRIRRGQILPPGVIAEDIERKKDIWTYAVFVSALLHDIGKPVTDFSFVAKTGLRWNLLSTSSMPEVYEIRYHKGRVHKLHERLPMMVMHKILDERAIEWLCADPLVFQHLCYFLSGDYSSTPLISEIIQKADQISVAANLGGDVQQVVATTAERPLHERFLHTLQQMLAEDAMPINRKGAAAFTANDRVYFVSKRLLDEVKDRMRKDGQSVPSRNDRLMDELQQFKVLLPNEDKAIWRCKVQIDDWEMNFSLLCFDAAKVWPSLDDRPEQPANQNVTPIDVNGKPIDQTDSQSVKTEPEKAVPQPDSKAKKSEPKPPPAKAEPKKYEPESKPKSKTVPEESKTSNKQEDSLPPELDELDALLAAPVPSTDDLIGDFSDFAETDDFDDMDAIEDLVLPDPEEKAAKASKKPQPAEPKSQLKSKKQVEPELASVDREAMLEDIKAKAAKGRSNSVAYHNEKVAEQADSQIEFDDPDCPAALFIKWLTAGVAEGKIPANNPANQVHFVEEGLFLVSPAIFKTFERQTRVSWTIAQKDLTKKKINLKTQRGDNIFQYEISSKSGRNAPRVIKGILIPDPQKIGLKSSQINEYLRLIND